MRTLFRRQAASLLTEHYPALLASPNSLTVMLIAWEMIDLLPKGYPILVLKASR
ncbi:MAG TPA: hypothetical protein VF043_04075 [Ktedonobacteraceae bacterium]